MSRSRTLLSVLLAAGTIGALALALLRWLPGREAGARPMPVPDGDREIAWLHTSTSASSWERFVTGVLRVPGFEVDDSRAFLERTTSIPEVVLSRPGQAGRLRIRWYKLTNESNTRQWVDALAQRSPPPLAIIGGGSTDRAVELGRALEARKDWRGSRPLFLITTATANEVYLDEQPDQVRSLIGIYPGRSFRFCFHNEQMARAVVDFVWQTPDLRPSNGCLASVSVLGAAATLLAHCGIPLAPSERPVQVHALEWADDPYSLDLAEHFRRVVHDSPLDCRVQVSRQGLPFSVGLLNRAHKWEADAAEQILRELPTGRGQRSMLVLPTIAPPARRILRALTGEAPMIGEHLVAVTGDGISFNVIYRDADIQWPIRELPVPLVLFTHQNPIAWDDGTGVRVESSSGGTRAPLLPPSSTDDVLLFAELARRTANAAFDETGLVADSDAMATRLRERESPFFDAEGNRLGGKGEFVICLRPRFSDGGRVTASSSIEVWNRRNGMGWELVGRLAH